MFQLLDLIMVLRMTIFGVSSSAVICHNNWTVTCFVKSDFLRLKPGHENFRSLVNLALS